jgi:hypothetical protein
VRKIDTWKNFFLTGRARVLNNSPAAGTGLSLNQSGFGRKLRTLPPWLKSCGEQEHGLGTTSSPGLGESKSWAEDPSGNPVQLFQPLLPEAPFNRTQNR